MLSSLVSEGAISKSLESSFERVKISSTIRRWWAQHEIIMPTLSRAAAHRSPKAARCGDDVVAAVIRALMSASSERTRSAQ
jgi:hypothetical protein